MTRPHRKRYETLATEDRESAMTNAQNCATVDSRPWKVYRIKFAARGQPTHEAYVIGSVWRSTIDLNKADIAGRLGVPVSYIRYSECMAVFPPGNPNLIEFHDLEGFDDHP